MKNLLVLTAFLISGAASAANLTVEAYVDAGYRCNWIEDSTTKLDAKDADEAKQLIGTLIGQSVSVKCTRAEYYCHHGQDVEPRLIGKPETRAQELTIIGVSLREDGKEIAKTGAGYHQNLRRTPDCNRH